MSRILIWALLPALLSFAACGGKQGDAKAGADSANKQRLITLSPVLTEIVYALGAEGQLVGRDKSSVFPEAAKSLTDVGYQRVLTAEAILAQNPSLILATPEAGPAAVMDQVKSAGVKIEVIANEPKSEAGPAQIRAVGKMLGLDAKAEELAKQLETKLKEVADKAAATKAPKIACLYITNPNAPLTGFGKNTAPHAVIELVGGKQVFDFESIKPVSAEQMLALDPDFILLPESAVGMKGGIEAVLSDPALAKTRVAKNKAVLVVKDVNLFGFGPSSGDALLQLQSRLMPKAAQ